MPLSGLRSSCDACSQRAKVRNSVRLAETPAMQDSYHVHEGFGTPASFLCVLRALLHLVQVESFDLL